MTLHARLVLAIVCAQNAWCLPSASEVPWPDLDLALAFVALDEDGAYSIPYGGFSLEAGEPPPLPDTQLALRETAQLLVIGFSAEAITGLSPSVELGALPGSVSLGQRTRNAACSELQFDRAAGAKRVRRPIPDEAVILALAPEERMFSAASDALRKRLKEDLELDLPLANNRCGSAGSATLRPFTERGFAIPNGGTVSSTTIQYESEAFDDLINFETGAWLDEDRVVLVSERILFLFERGAVWRDVPERVLDLETLGLRSCQVRRSPRTLGGGSPEILLACDVFEAGSTNGGALAIFTTLQNRLSYVKTATRSAQFLIDLAVDESGRIVLVGPEGLVMTAPSADGPFLRYSLGDFLFSRVVFTGDTRVPNLIAGHENVLFAGDAFGGAQTFQRIQLPKDQITSDDEVQGLAAVRSGDELLIFAADDLGHLYRGSLGGAVEELPILLPPAGVGCALPSEPCNAPRLIEDLEDLYLDARRPDAPVIYLTNDLCTGVFQYHAKTGCTTVSPPTEGAVTQDEDYRLEHLQVQGDRLLVTGHSARLYELMLPAF